MYSFRRILRFIFIVYLIYIFIFAFILPIFQNPLDAELKLDSLNEKLEVARPHSSTNRSPR